MSMTLEGLIRRQTEECLKAAVRMSTQATLTEDMWLKVINSECASIYSSVADNLLTALRDAEDVVYDHQSAGKVG